LSRAVGDKILNGEVNPRREEKGSLGLGAVRGGEENALRIALDSACALVKVVMEWVGNRATRVGRLRRLGLNGEEDVENIFIIVLLLSSMML